MGPDAMLCRLAARRFHTQRDGDRGPDSVVPPEGLVGQRRLASLGAGALHAARRQVELPGRQHLDPEGVLEGAREPVEGDPAAHG